MEVASFFLLLSFVRNQTFSIQTFYFCVDSLTTFDDADDDVIERRRL